MLKRVLTRLALLAVVAGSLGLTVGGQITVGGAVTAAGAPVLFRGAFPIPFQTAVNGGTPTVYTRPYYVPSDVTAVNPRIRNAYGLAALGPAFTSNAALYKSDGTGAATGSALGLWNGIAIPGDGTDWFPGLTSITRGTDGKIVLLESLPANQYSASSVTPLTHGTYTSNTSTVSPPPAPTASDPTPVSWVHLDFTTARRRLVVVGDSICVGTSSTTGFEISAFYQLGPSKDYAVAQLCLPGSSLAQWAAFSTTSATWWADGVFAGSDAWIQAGVNDVTGSTAAAMEVSITTIVNHLRALGVRNIYANTIAPNNATNETTRTGYNTWLLANSLGLTAIADFAAKQNVGGLADNTTPSALFASYDAGDHLHWADPGQNQAAAKVNATVMGLSPGFAVALFLAGLLSAHRARWRFIWQRPAANDNAAANDEQQAA